MSALMSGYAHPHEWHRGILRSGISGRSHPTSDDDTERVDDPATDFNVGRPDGC